MASFGSDSQYQYGQSTYDPYKNLRRPRAALSSLLGTTRSSLAPNAAAGAKEAVWASGAFKGIFGSTSTSASATKFESALQGVKDPLSLYSLASSLVVGRRKYQLAGGGYGNTSGNNQSLGGGAYVSRALKNVLGLNFDYKTNKYTG